MVSAIVVAAGKGVRMGNTISKQYLRLGERPILGHTLMTIDACQLVDKIYLVVPAGDFDFCRQNIIAPLKLSKEIKLVPGGAARQDSVYNGLLKIEEKAGIVVIHDGVRPFVLPEQLAMCINGAKESGACILGIPAVDTLKKVNEAGFIKATIGREGVWHAQTPQAFKFDLIIKAHKKARQAGYVASDDALLVERLGEKITMLAGSIYNIKITTKEDLLLAQAIIDTGQILLPS
ncbi:2-C-methyl-D-erythritol 4-phosphate cytidylyltransferase [Thermodesulfobacteriota bacterium]